MPKTCVPDKWIPCALKHHKPGSLHRMLHVPVSESIPTPLLEAVKRVEIGGIVKRRGQKPIKVTRLLKQRAVLALTLRSFGGKK